METCSGILAKLNGFKRDISNGLYIYSVTVNVVRLSCCLPKSFTDTRIFLLTTSILFSMNKTACCSMQASSFEFIVYEGYTLAAFK